MIQVIMGKVRGNEDKYGKMRENQAHMPTYKCRPPWYKSVSDEWVGKRRRSGSGAVVAVAGPIFQVSGTHWELTQPSMATKRAKIKTCLSAPNRPEALMGKIPFHC